jgi:hypothetical protein
MVNARLGRANTISSAMRSRMMPPEVCSAGSDTPSWVKMNFPTTAATARTAVAMPHAFKAIRLWDALDCFDVKLAKMTAQSTGPTVVKNMVKAASARAKLVGALIWSALTDLDEPRNQRCRILGMLCRRQPQHNLTTG